MGADGYFEGLKTINVQLAEIMGRRYVIDHCISAFRQSQEEKLFRVYVTDCLRAAIRSDGARYWDLIKPQTDTRTDVEIVNSIKDKMRRLMNEPTELGGVSDAGLN